MRLITLLVVVAAVIAFGTLVYVNRRIPTPEELEFDKKFDREAVLVKTCGLDPGVASAVPLKVYRFESLHSLDQKRTIPAPQRSDSASGMC
jgi:hypothetical protein